MASLPPPLSGCGSPLGCSVEEFIPLLRERMSVVNQKVQQFLVGWIKVLDSVPDIDMLSFLPDFLDGQLACSPPPCLHQRLCSSLSAAPARPALAAIMKRPCRPGMRNRDSWR